MRNENQPHLIWKLALCSQSTPLCIGTVEQWVPCDCFYQSESHSHKRFLADTMSMEIFLSFFVFFLNVPHMNCRKTPEHELLSILTSEGTVWWEGHFVSCRGDFPFASFPCAFIFLIYFCHQNKFYTHLLQESNETSLSVLPVAAMWEFLGFTVPA